MVMALRCRKCGRTMKSQRIDNYRVKMTCACGFSDFQTATEKLKTVNPYFQRASFTPLLQGEHGTMVLSMQKMDREHLEIISLEEISMLVSSDFDLPEMLQRIATKMASRLKVSVCTIYLMEGDELVMAATHGFDPSFVGKIRIRIGEGITGTVARTGEYLSLANASKDPRYKLFPELQEEKYNSMLSFPIADKNGVIGVINLNATSMKKFQEDEIYFVSIIANLILTAVKLRQQTALSRKGTS
jgi:transcriptional regulator with GAF, ATPase, and Fis domain